MSYTHFRMIAYEVPTAAPSKTQPLVVSGWNPGNQCAAIQDIPVPDDNQLSDDAKNRLLRLAAVVDLASTRLAGLGGDDDSTLKVFMVPEFYFRPPAYDNRYAYSTYPQTEALHIGKALRSMFKANRFQHWLFVCGTVMENTREINPLSPVYLNTAYWVHGGNRGFDGSWGWVEKNLPSRIDGVPLDRAPGTAEEIKHIMRDAVTLKQHVFTIEGIPIGLEVCWDHANEPSCQVLRDVLNKWPAWHNGATQDVKLHLLIAGGMLVNEKSVAAKVGGYLLRNDGYADGGKPSQLAQIDHYLNGYDKQRVGFNARKVQTAQLRYVVPQEYVLLRSDMELRTPGAGYTLFFQRLLFYPSLPIPA